MGDRLEAARGVEMRGALVGDGLVLDESMLARQPDGVFVQAFGVQLPTFQARNLSAHQRRATPKVLGTILRPLFKLLTMGH